AAAVAAQLVHHRPEDATAGGADRMSERDGAAVHVRLLRVGPEQLDGVDGDRRERLVHLDPLDVVDRLPGLLERDRSRLGGSARKEVEESGDGGLANERNQRLEAAAPG